MTFVDILKDPTLIQDNYVCLIYGYKHIMIAMCKLENTTHSFVDLNFHIRMWFVTYCYNIYKLNKYDTKYVHFKYGRFSIQ